MKLGRTLNPNDCCPDMKRKFGCRWLQREDM